MGSRVERRVLHVRRGLACAAVGLATAAVALAANDSLTGDIYWLLAAGRSLVQHGFQPVDPFLTLSHGRAWLNQQWLAELGFYALHRLGGMRLVTLAYALLLGAAAVPLVLGVRKRDWRLGIVAWALFLPVLVAVLDPRAEGFSLFAFSLLVVLVDGEARRWRVWLVPPLFVVWANVHGAFLVGLAFLALVAAGRWIDGRRGLYRPGPGRRLVAFGAALPAVLATPLGTGIATYVGRLGGNPLLPQLTFEWDPTPEHPALLLYVAAVVVFAGLLWWRAERPRPVEPLLVVGALALFSLTATRELLWLGPLGFYALRQLGAPAEWRLPRRALAPAAGVALAAVAGWAVLVGAPPPEAKLSARLAESIARHPVPGRIAVAAGTGSYLLWRAPHQQITIDGRFESYDVAELEASYAAVRGDPAADVDAVVTRDGHAVARLRHAGFRVERRLGGATLLRRG